MALLILDNGDPFLHLYIQRFKAWQVDFVNLPLAEAASKLSDIDPTHILISGGDTPWPSFFKDWLAQCPPNRQVLAIGTGMLQLGHYFGGQWQAARPAYYALPKRSIVSGAYDPVLQHLPREFEAVYYQKFILAQPLPNILVPTVKDSAGQIAAFRHRRLAFRGIQFQLDSLYTPAISSILKEWLLL